jgi:hypothetical protein
MLSFPAKPTLFQNSTSFGRWQLFVFGYPKSSQRLKRIISLSQDYQAIDNKGEMAYCS